MLGKNNNYMNQQKKGQKFEKYSIKKLKVGAASVLVGAGFFFGYHVEASEVTEHKTVLTTEQNTLVDKEDSKSTTVENNTKTEVVSTHITEVVETPKSQEAPVEQKVQTTELQEKVSALQTEVNRIRANEKQKSQIEQAEKLIEEAKELQASKTATQQEVNAKAKEISSLTTILKSMKAEETVKENKNQDSRNGKKMEEGVGFRADTATGTGISADVKDATSTPAATRDGYTDRAAAESFTKQVTWLDFGDTGNWQNVDKEGGKIYLKEGSTYSKEVIPGYVINIKVKSLKPFQATEIYRKRMEAANASEEEKATFNPNATNQYFGDKSGPTRITANQQDGTWSEIRNNGINTGNKKTAIGSESDWSNVGVQFEISATYKGKNVRPAVVMNDSESANHGENIILTTNGSPWERVLELKKERFVGGTFTPTPYKPINNYNLRHEDYPQSGGRNNAAQLLWHLREGLLTFADGRKLAPKYFTNPDQETGGLGTGVFGPVTSSGGYSLPVLMTKDATEVGLYILSSGIQTAMMGVIPIDEGDAPESYGKVSHMMNTTDGLTGAEVKQPYLGSTRPDMDTGTTKDWYGDDKDLDGDEGVNQLLPENLKGSEGNIIKANISNAGHYTLNVQAHTGGAEKAYIRSWIDFNKNGQFDADEASEIATVTQDGTVKLNFKNKISTDAETLLEAGARVRIATVESEIENPTGTAFSGEVEDFIAKITHPPKGEKKTTIGNIKETQREEIQFTAQGRNVYLEDHSYAEIDTTVQPTYIDNKTGQEVTLASDGTYTVEGEGTYKFTISDNRKDVKVEFTPADGFIGKAHGISIRRQDTNKTTTDWGTPDAATLPNVNDSLNTMDGLYIPEVTVPTSVEATPINAESQNIQGLPQKGKPTFNVESAKEPVTASAKYPAKLVDPRTNAVTELTTVDAFEQGTTNKIGTYTIVPETGEVTFTPNKDFKGIPAPATISADVELTHDKNGNVTTKTLQATYSPTIIPVTPTATPSETVDIQGAEQSKEVTFTAGKATVNGEEVEVPMNNKEYKLLGEDGQPAESVPAKNPAGELIGTYTLKVVDGKPTAVFTPTNKLYSGEVKPVTIQGKDTNGTAVTTTYTPRITPVVPTGTPVATEGVQGATQEGTPTFTQGNDKVPMKIDADQPAKLVDPETGNPTNETTIPAKDETGKQVGTYTIEPTTGKVIFTPNKDFAGTPVPATVEAKDANGTPATAKYTPTVKGATPTATPSETVDIQGAEQSKEVTFTAGKATVNGEEVEVPMNNKEYKLLGEDGQPAESVPAKNPAGEVIGTYTLKVVDGKPTAVFTPTNKLYSGEVKPVTIQGKDTNGTAVTTTYTPRITPVVPTGTPVATEGVQGATQEGTPTFTQGNDKVPMKIDADQPAKLVDPETGNPTNETTIPAKDETGKQVGTYTIEPTTGKVTFTPNKDFAGTPVPATVEAKDANGTPATAKYTPTVKGATPTATPSETVDIQGAEQSKEVTFTAGKATVNGEEVEVPMDNNEYKLLGEDGQPAESVPAKNPAGEVIGTYTLKVVDGKPTAVFTPTNKLYSGEVKPVTIQGKDTNGTAVTTTYTPRITPVVPTGTPVATEGVQGATQEGTPTFTQGNDKVPMKIDADQPAKLVDPETGNPTNETTIPAKDETGKQVGTYTIESTTGKVTFTPNKDFAGTPVPATVEAKDANGTPATAKYTPTVKGVTPTATPSETVDIQGAEQSKEVTFTAGKATVNGEEVEVPMNNNEYKLLGEDGQPAESVPAKNPAGEVIGTYTLKVVDGKPTAVFTPTNKLYSGEVKPVTIQGKDTNGTAVTTTYTPRITPVVPTGTPVATEGVQGATQEGTPTFTQGNDKVPMKIDADQPAKLVDPETGNPTNETTIPAKDETGKQVGTYTIESTTGKVTFTPNKDFAGTPVPATVEAKDANGTPATAKYTPTVKGVTPTATPSETVDIQGAEQSKEVTFIAGKATVNGEEVEVPMNNNEYKLLGEDGQPAESVPAKNPAGEVIGTYTLKVVDGKPTAVFTPTNKLYSGEVKPVTIQGKDTNGTAVTTTYTPRITPVTPTGTPAETTGIQGKEQEGTPTFKPGNPNVPIDEEVAPTLEGANPEGKVVVPGEGTYTVDKDGKVTFTPEPQFTGVAKGVTVKRVDKNGTPVTATYTPTVTPVTPEGTPAETTGIQGATQEGTPTFKPGNPNVPIDEEVAPTLEGANPEGKVVVPGEGTYTVDKDGKVTFTPEPQFTGTAKGVTVKRVDKNGTPVTAKYTPTVTPVTPEGTAAETTGIQGATQEGTPTFKPGNPNVPIDEEVAPTLEGANPEGKVVVPGEGTYTVDKEGKVTFTPEPQFTGVAKGVTVKRVDKNGTPVTAKYTPTVTPVTPEGTPAETTGIQGKEQEGTPTFKPGNPNVPIDEEVAPTLEGANPEGKVVVPGEGTYTVDKDGKVTFTPEPQFTGTAKGVTVKRVDKNGTPVTATYTPTVTPVTPAGENAETEGPKAQPQTSTIVFDKKDEDNSTVNFNKGHENVALDPTTTTLVGKDGKPTTEVKVPGEGTYTLANNVITFTPEPDFAGKASGVTVQVKDANGTTVEKTYTPTVRPVTIFVDEAGNPITVDKNNTPVVPEEDGTQPKKDIHGYTFKETKKDAKGNTIHVYQKVSIPRGENESTGNNTSKENKPSEKGIIRDKDGNSIPGFEYDRMSPILDIPEYVYVETVTDPDGTVRHIYRPIETVHKDKDGNPIPNVVSKEKGSKESKVIPGYRLVATKKLPNGDVEHVYEKVQATTTWIDELGNVIQSTEEGLLNPRDIPGYEFVRTETDANGNVRHVYRRIATSQATVKPSTTVEQRKNELPNTGTGEEFTIFGAAVASILAGLGIAIPGKKKEEE